MITMTALLAGALFAPSIEDYVQKDLKDATFVAKKVRASQRELQKINDDFGMSYRFTEKRSVNTQFEFGVTSDAPNVGITIRMPFAS